MKRLEFTIESEVVGEAYNLDWSPAVALYFELEVTSETTGPLRYHTEVRKITLVGAMRRFTGEDVLELMQTPLGIKEWTKEFAQREARSLFMLGVST